MVGRLRFAWAQPITIIGFFLASIILIVLVSITSRPSFRPDPPTDYALTQAWYYACWAAGLYFIITILMLITVYGALTNKFPRQFELNGSQRTLMLQTTAFMVYLVGGAAVYTRLEGWSYPDAVFWADVTLLTIGFGTPLVPATHAGRSLLIPYVFGGLIAVGLVIGSIRSMLLEKGAIKMHARATEKRRQKIIDMRDADKVSSPIMRLFRRKKNKPSQRADTHYRSERERRRQEFLAMRKIQADAENKQKWLALFFSSLAAVGLWTIGALIFYKAEYAQSWTYFQSLYFAFVSLTTLGYGDFEPYSNSGKSFFVLWSLLAIPTLTVLVSDLGGTIVSIIAELTALIGSLTVAPTDKEFWRRLRRNVDIVFGQRKHPNNNSNTKADKDSLHILKKKKGNNHSKNRLGRWQELLRSRLTESEQNAIDKYGREHGESAEERDKLFYHFLLTKEIRTVLRDSQMDKKKTYTYDEWAYFLKLIGHDEEDDEMHTKKYNLPKRDGEKGPQAGRIVDHDGKPMEWSWLSLRSPLLSQMSEPEWILDRMLKKLQSELHFESRTGNNGYGQDRPRLDMSRFLSRQDEARKASRSEGSHETEQEDEANEKPSEHTAWKRHEERKAQEEEEEEEEDEEGEEEEEDEAEQEDVESDGDKTAKDADDRERERKGEMDEAVDEASKKPEEQKSSSQ